MEDLEDLIKDPKDLKDMTDLKDPVHFKMAFLSPKFH